MDLFLLQIGLTNSLGVKNFQFIFILVPQNDAGDAAYLSALELAR